MRKNRVHFFVLLLLLVAAATIKPGSVFAAAGDRATPHSAWDYHEFKLQEYSSETPKTVSLQLLDIFTGEEANELVASENMFNDVPGPGEHWIVMPFALGYVKGPEESLGAYDIISSSYNFYTPSGQKISPKSIATFSNDFEGQGEFDVEFYPGNEDLVLYGILVSDTIEYPMVRIGSGVTSSGSTIYKWFSTDPSYLEPVVSLKATPSTYNSNKITWTKATGVTGYDIYRSTSSTGTFTKIGTVKYPGTSYTNTGLNTGTTYYYKIKTYYIDEDGYRMDGKFSPVVSAQPVLCHTSLSQSGFRFL
ncbi:hypothetical protein AM500_05410 [Bacillus sp. FJAT-18017]|uniref:hypothetical protein n=1 Tax=Bacillus sp. FJAT-18017 TaxID=1705566 RepID=UPI0006AE4D4E|nr:hypothetical protein [Bacillus sp. FJAT-18017]ALC89285.1 hypothetical protein AM500_05410 [Bacillus sp. FJAT-18017]